MPKTNHIVAKITGNRVKLYNAGTGNLVSSISQPGAVSAVANSEAAEVYVTLSTGLVRVFGSNGNLKRTL